MMIRKLILPAIAVALLGGCMTGGYSYRQDRGDYYYGQPSTDYRYYGDHYGYGSGYYGRSYYGYTRQSYPYYSYPYYGSRHDRYPYGYYRPPVVVRPRPDDDNRPDRNDDNKAPWRDYERLQRERVERSSRPVVQRRAVAVPARPAQVNTPVRTRSSQVSSGNSGNSNSRMGQIIRRAKERRAHPTTVEP